MRDTSLTVLDRQRIPFKSRKLSRCNSVGIPISVFDVLYFGRERFPTCHSSNPESTSFTSGFPLVPTSGYPPCSPRLHCDFIVSSKTFLLWMGMTRKTRYHPARTHGFPDSDVLAHRRNLRNAFPHYPLSVPYATGFRRGGILRAESTQQARATKIHSAMDHASTTFASRIQDKNTAQGSYPILPPSPGSM
jgi:hypothetical protein